MIFQWLGDCGTCPFQSRLQYRPPPTSLLTPCGTRFTRPNQMRWEKMQRKSDNEMHDGMVKLLDWSDQHINCQSSGKINFFRAMFLILSSELCTFDNNQMLTTRLPPSLIRKLCTICDGVVFTRNVIGIKTLGIKSISCLLVGQLVNGKCWKVFNVSGCCVNRKTDKNR